MALRVHPQPDSNLNTSDHFERPEKILDTILNAVKVLRNNSKRLARAAHGEAEVAGEVLGVLRRRGAHDHHAHLVLLEKRRHGRIRCQLDLARKADDDNPFAKRLKYYPGSLSQKTVS